MFTPRRLYASCFLVLCLISTVVAQVEQPANARQLSAAVTATATAERIRFTAPNNVVQLRLEVYTETGQKLFDTELRGGNVIDWSLQDGQGQRLADGEYLCLVTVKNLSGRLNQKLCALKVAGQEAALRAVDVTQLTNLQAQAVGPVEENAPIAVLPAGELQSAAVITHDGTDAQVTRTRGAFSFRFGDFFSGKDTEQMRLTEEGNLGIGTDKPKAKLDVMGMISAREGLMFSDGSTLNVNDNGELMRTTASGEIVPNAAGTGTAGRLAKWTETGGAGTLGNSVVTEAGGKLGIGTATPNYALTLFGSDIGLQLVSPVTGTTATDGFRFGISSANHAFLWNTEATDMFFGTSATERMRITSAGNVGIGTTTPSVTLDVVGTTKLSSNLFVDTDSLVVSAATGRVGVGTTTPGAKLDVAGNINTSTEYRIGGSRVLSLNAGNSSLFVGVGAGAVNTGVDNAFFGKDAGLSNETGRNNSFFGRTAGQQNTTGVNNSFFGRDAGFSNTTGDENTFIGSTADFDLTNTTGNRNTLLGAESRVASGLNNATAIGYRARVDQSNSLVLGSINGVNTTATKVGIGTTLPFYPLTVLGNAGSGAAQGVIELRNADNDTGLRITNNTPSGRSYTLFSSGGTSGIGPGNFSIFDAIAGQARLSITSGGNVGIGVINPAAKLDVNGSVRIAAPSAGTGALLCHNAASGLIVDCSASSARYKGNIFGFRAGLDVVRRLRPVTFRWKEGGEQDLGLIAEEVNQVEPLLVTRNATGQIEGVKYQHLNVVLINAIKQQQAQIRSQQRQLQERHSRIAALEGRLATLEIVVSKISLRQRKARRH